MTKVSKTRWLKFISPLLITAMILSSLVVFPSSAVAFTASLEREGTGSLGGDRYLLGEWVIFTGSVDFAAGEAIDIDSINFVVDGPEPLNVSLPVEEGTHNLGTNLIAIVTWNNVTGESNGYGYGYSLAGGSGGGSIDYEIQWRPAYMLSSPDAELPDNDFGWNVPDVPGLNTTKKVQGIASDGSNLYLLVDGVNRDIIVKTDLNGNVLSYFNAPNKETRAIAYLDGDLYVYAEGFQRILNVTDEIPTYDQYAFQGKYRLPTVWNNNWDNDLIETSLVVTADGEPASVTNVNANDGSFDILWGEVWDDKVVRGPSVVKVGTAYHMWYYSDQGTGGDEKIGHATSSDGINWTKDTNNPVLVGDAGAWDASGVLNPSVVYDSSVGIYKMWYIGHSDLADHRVGYATSADGVNWSKHTGNPVLNPGAGDSWDSEAIWDITVLINGSIYEMWYTATSAFDDVPKIGYASSTNGINWQGLSLTDVKIFGLAANDFTDPSWSPDGSKLAAVKNGDLWVVNADGSSATNVTGSWSLNILNETIVDDTATGANGFSWTGSSWTTDTYWDYNGGSAQYSSNPPAPIVTPESDTNISDGFGFTFAGDWWDEVDWGASEQAVKYANNLPAPVITPETPGTNVIYTQNWDLITDGGANGGKYRKLLQSDNNDPLIAYTGGSVSFTFSGTEVALRYVVDSWGGKVGVDIDGTPYDNINMYSPWFNFTSTTIADNLSSGTHTLTITQLNEKDSSSWGYRVSVDGIETPNPVRNMATINFTGTEVTLRYKVGDQMGRASVSIDGVAYPNIDMYNPSWNLNTKVYSSLSAGPHTMVITQLEEKHNLSYGYRVYVDGIQQADPIANTATVTFTGTGVKLLYRADWDGGRLGVTIDGTDYGYVGMYNSGYQKKETTIADSLSNGTHTMVLTQRTDKNTSSSGYKVYIDGIKVITPATLSGGTESSPAWHPGDNRIAFATDITGKNQLFEVNVTSLESPVFTRITNDSAENKQPTWAPGGDMIAYSANRGSGYNYDILVIESLTGGIWSASWSIADDWMKNFYNPDWSPDGNYIAFAGADIDVIQVDENGQASGGWSSVSGDSVAIESHPSWNADSTMIAYASKPTSTGANEIWVMTYNLGNPYQSMNSARQLTNSASSNEKEPDWSADGSWIAYASNKNGNFEIWKVNNIQTNPLLSPASGQGWDGKGLYSPTVLKGTSKYYMWYVGQEYWGNRKTIGYASSDDGKTWVRNSERVFDTQWNSGDNWEDWHVYDPVVISDNGYKMYYAGQNGSSESAIGRAASANGTTWQRNINNPLLEGGRGDAVVRASYSYKKGWPENSIVKINGDNGSYIKHFQAPNMSQIGGLAASDTDLYAVRPDFGSEIWQINPENGSWSNKNPWSDKGYWINGGDALEYKDGDLYLGKNGDVFVIDWNDNKVTDKYNTGLTGINGLGFLENTLYIGASSGPGKVYKSAIPGTVEKSSIGDYQAWIDADDTTSEVTTFTLEKLGVPVDVEITEPVDGFASQTPEVTIAGIVNDPSIDRVLVGIALPSTNLLGDDMEKGDSATGGSFMTQSVEGKGWIPYSASNLWHVSNKRSLSGGKSWGYNKTDGFGYNTPGKANAGGIVSIPFNIGDGAELRFWTSWDTDSWVDVDRKLVDIYVDGSWKPLAYIVDGDWYPDPFGGARQRLVIPMAWQWKADGTGGSGAGWNWYEAVIDLSAYAGAMDAKIRFRFDTMDDWMNDFEGWYIDDVTVTGAGFKGTYAEVTDMEFSASYTLAEGYNTITVNAQSSYITGPQGSDEETITVSLDTTGPTVILNPMVPNTRQGSVEVSGTIYELNFDNLVVSINDKPFYTLNSIPAGKSAPQWTFSTQVPLFEGENIITATGTDTAGLTGGDTITIIRDSTPPTIEILPTVYFLGENAARTGDLLVLQLDAIDLSPADTDYVPAGVAEVLLQTPGGGGWEHFITSDALPDAIIDQWGTTGGYVFPITIPEDEDVPPGSYSFTVKAIDNAGNESWSTVSVLIVSTLSAYNIYLMPEWNMISLPLIPDNGSIDALMSDVEGVESVWYYNAETADWQVYNSGDAPDSMTTMETGKGYWVYMDEAAFDYSAPLDAGLPETPAAIKMSYTGQVLMPATVPPTYKLEAGWNAIGLHSERSKNVSLYLRPVSVPEQVWASLLQYDNYINFEIGQQEGEGGAEIYLGSFRTLLDTDEMVPGKGFWLYLVQPGNVVAQP